MKTKFLYPSSKVKLVGLWIKLGMFFLVAVDIIVSFARTNPSFAATPGSLEEQIAIIFQDSLPALIGVLAVMVIIIAGIIYAFDLGGGKQSGLAKEMIISAISGVVLFILARWLLTEISGLFGTSPASPGALSPIPPSSPGSSTPGSPAAPGGIPIPE